MNYQIFKTSLILIVLFCITPLVPSGENDINVFLKSIKTHEDINANINFKNLISFEEYKLLLMRVVKVHNVNVDNFEKEFKLNYADELEYNAKTKRQCVTNKVKKINLSLFRLPFELKKLNTGEILVLFNEDKKRLKIPLVLIQENNKYQFDARTFVSTINIVEFNELSHIEVFDVKAVLDYSWLIHFKADLDYTYLIDGIDLYKNSQNKEIIDRIVSLGSYFKSILKVKGLKLMDKNFKLDSREAKLIAAMFDYSINIHKEKKEEDILDAYQIADDIIKNMTAEEKKLYLTEKNNR